eukprot:CAMPEP_0181312852 /NCGR_PEP_ID=MMETSP1101-20121128/13925_1 /TAXON_ID=46948 /ORGANISM="Rhodomonas abbreviata, Strain Caron Lab Isolate" /LENGTH=768 /DNA_ID=CAMNT_0023419745 /DNA_START=402 /DNA_END=2705 /DNA_ORIENTATION=-
MYSHPYSRPQVVYGAPSYQHQPQHQPYNPSNYSSQSNYTHLGQNNDNSRLQYSASSLPQSSLSSQYSNYDTSGSSTSRTPQYQSHSRAQAPPSSSSTLSHSAPRPQGPPSGGNTSLSQISQRSVYDYQSMSQITTSRESARPMSPSGSHHTSSTLSSSAVPSENRAPAQPHNQPPLQTRVSYQDSRLPDSRLPETRSSFIDSLPPSHTLLSSSNTRESADQDHRPVYSSRPLDPMRSSGVSSGMSSTALPDFEKERLKGKVDELQGLVDRQAGDLRRRNEELLDLQRNHEAFREKFILFREGMRSKTDESDARFRKLEAELKLAHEELTTRREQNSGGDAKQKHLERQLEALRTSNGELEQKLSEARKSLSSQGDVAHKDSVIKELSTRVANQADHIRTFSGKVADLETRLREAQEAAIPQNTNELSDMQSKYRDLESRSAGQAKALNAQALKEMELGKALEEERRTVAALRADVDSLTSQKRAAVQEAEKERDAKQSLVSAMQSELDYVKRQLSESRGKEQSLHTQLEQARPDAQLPRALQEAQDDARRRKEEAERSEVMASERKKQVDELAASLRTLQAETSMHRTRAEQAEGRVKELEERLGETNRNAEYLNNQLQHSLQQNQQQQQQQQQQQALLLAQQRKPEATAEAGAMRNRLLKTRDTLLGKLIGNWQKQTLGRSFAAWLRSIEAFKMDRILMESDKYMSMDSSIDDLLNDALSKRRARSIVASSVSLGGSSIDDEVFQAAAARPVSGGSVASFGGSSMSG